VAHGKGLHEEEGGEPEQVEARHHVAPPAVPAGRRWGGGVLLFLFFFCLSWRGGGGVRHVWGGGGGPATFPLCPLSFYYYIHTQLSDSIARGWMWCVGVRKPSLRSVDRFRPPSPVPALCDQNTYHHVVGVPPYYCCCFSCHHHPLHPSCIVPFGVVQPPQQPRHLVFVCLSSLFVEGEGVSGWASVQPKLIFGGRDHRSRSTSRSRSTISIAHACIMHRFRSHKQEAAEGRGLNFTAWYLHVIFFF
jgi:hypothetical protein